MVNFSQNAVIVDYDCDVILQKLGDIGISLCLLTGYTIMVIDCGGFGEFGEQTVKTADNTPAENGKSVQHINSDRVIVK